MKSSDELLNERRCSHQYTNPPQSQKYRKTNDENQQFKDKCKGEIFESYMQLTKSKKYKHDKYTVNIITRISGIESLNYIDPIKLLQCLEAMTSPKCFHFPSVPPNRDDWYANRLGIPTHVVTATRTFFA